MIARQPVGATLGDTQASSVIALVRSSDAESGTVTRAVVPLKLSAPPNLPDAVRVATLIVPVFVFPDVSVTVVPLGSSKPYAATRPVGGGATLPVVADATFEYGPNSPAASVARTRYE